MKTDESLGTGAVHHLATCLKACSVLAVVLLMTLQAHAQYFGRNRVQYDDFDFRVLHTPHFDIYYYPTEEEAVKIGAHLAERWYARHQAILQDTLHGVQPLVLYASQPQFEENNIVGALGVGVGGVTEPAKRRIVLPFAGPLRETNHVIGHELVHAFQYDITGQGQSSFSLPGAERLPLWFIEGMAEYMSLGPVDPNTAMWIREAVRNKKLPDYSDLSNSEFFPYRYGQALLAYIGKRWGERKLGDMLRAAGTKGDMRMAIDSTLFVSPDSLVKAWHAEVHAEYDSMQRLTSEPKAYGPLLISKENGGGRLNVSPVISPDGTKLAFFSERDQFSIDLFLADAKTGKIGKNIFRSELDPHLQSLEFINSAGAWDPTGEWFVFAGVAKGRPILTVVDAQKATVSYQVPFPDIGEIFDPAWSPDGTQIVFSGLSKGFSNLFLYNVATQKTRQLTDDAFAEFQPAWSPDGKEIAFVTDRFSTQLSDLKIGNYQLALMDVSTGAIEALASFENGKNINPQWSPDGKHLYFISDQNGISNIYVMDMVSRSMRPLTNLFGGVSGITATSPALSVASAAGDIVYSVFENGNYSIYAADSLQAGHTVQLLTEGHPGALVSPLRPGDSLVALLHDPHIGSVSDTSFTEHPYHPSLSLTGIGGLSVGTGVDRFGAYVGGGATLFWSDMLGNHNLATALQVQTLGHTVDVSGLVGYENTEHRLYWGGVIQQYPYIVGGYASAYGVVKGEPAYLEQDYFYREINREVAGILGYPFSEVMRMEFTAGYRNITFRSQVETSATSLVTGAVLYDNTQDLPNPSAINLGTFSTAFVYDNSIMGATDPILGSRSRVEISPNFGSLSWVEILGDYRQYFMPLRPFTLAFRALHYGRYGKSAEDYRLSPLFLGYPGLVRGYDQGSFTASEVGTDTTGNTIFDRLQGSKLFVANAELRFPLFGLLGIGDGYYGFLPVELAGFFDTGMAWQNDMKVWPFGGDRKPLSSAGVALRVNLFGLVGEVDYVHPFNRPQQTWLWQFNLIQGI